ncbi:MAG: hypothetical protein VXW58_18335 [Pseudomonadota bacterium]|nr:hypothetical protein [Pseudomonadota bacterium]
MAVAFSIAFFAYVALVETLRNGVFGLSSFEITIIGHFALLLAAVALLRGDLALVVRRPRRSLDARTGRDWTIGRSLLALLLAPLLLVIPLAYGAVTGTVTLGALPQMLTAEQITAALAVSFVLNLFFREAAVKCFGGRGLALFLASGLACIIYALPQGPWAALIAAGSGIYYLALRVSGGNMLVITLAQAATTLIGPQLFGLPGGAEFARYAIWFTVAAIAMTLTVLSTLAPKQSELRYA